MPTYVIVWYIFEDPHIRYIIFIRFSKGKIKIILRYRNVVYIFMK